MLEKTFEVTKKLLDGSAILVVDVEPKYAEPSMYWDECGEKSIMLAKKIEERIQKLAKSLQDIQSRFPIFATFEEKLHPYLQNLNIYHLPYWASKKDGLPDEMIHVLKNYPQTLVCGLWRERCVFHVTYRLKDAGIHAILLNSRKYTLEASLSGSSDTLQETVKLCNLSLKEI